MGAFTLRRFLAQGGMGQVWEAYDEELRRPVALKFVRPDQVDARSLERFEREARAGGRLSHPSIVRTLAFNGTGNPSWIAQELVEGSWTLKDFLDELRAEDKTPEGYYRKVAELVAALAEGLEAAHQAGVIHRDIKPQNILITPNDSPKLTDFGLARVSDDSFLSVTGEFAGTYAYMSPEQVTAKRIGLDHRTDVFSLGVVLYELLSLRRPFEGDTTHQLSQRILFYEPPEPSKVRSQCPRELSIICGKALEKDPARRYPTMAEFSADLRRHLAHEPIHARPPGTLVRVVKWARRNPGPSVGVGVGASALVLISGAALVALDQASRAERGEQLAKDNAQQAELNAAAARRNATAAQLARDEATAKANDVLSLSAQHDHDDLRAEAARLWPAHPESIPAYEEWLRRANELIDGRPADESKGLKRRPSLAQHRAKLAELRAEARPLSEAEIAADRESHPRHAELQAKQAELLWRSRMLGHEVWPSEAAAEAELEQESLQADARAQNALAWPLVNPTQPRYGRELRGLLLARRAVAAASAEQRSLFRNTLAWALFRVGRLDEALAEQRAAQAEPGGEALKSSAADLEKAVASWREGELAKQRETHDTLVEDVAALNQLVNERRTYEFDDPEQEWWNRQLVTLVADLEALRDPQAGLMSDAMAEPFGWGVAKRHAFAQSIGARSVHGAQAARLWSDAIGAIGSSPKYGGLQIVPQLGLLPIGMDPSSGLWEFAHLQTGDPAPRGADGKLVLGEATGLVFVLIPGGKFWMGVQNMPGAQNHDPHAASDEGPVHEVELSPYFLSKYEMTQGQWQRIAATNPSYYRPPRGLAPSLLHPVEQVSWRMCFDLLANAGLSLPSEAQWECGARGGASSVWWTGQERESLRGKVNLADTTAKKLGGTWPAIADWPDLDDGSAVHCAVGKYEANGFGLHEVAGNVWEWCLDSYDSGFYRRQSGKDPLSPWSAASLAVQRGGGFGESASSARAAHREPNAPEYRTSDLGLRPARALRLSPAPVHSRK
ncbi:MAG: hypothetical protein FJ298_09330 [Planctomycetes bacterium]|nr:hypothetical protein [Planctomycetota bacterium]